MKLIRNKELKINNKMNKWENLVIRVLKGLNYFFQGGVLLSFDTN